MSNLSRRNFIKVGSVGAFALIGALLPVDFNNNDGFRVKTSEAREADSEIASGQCGMGLGCSGGGGQCGMGLGCGGGGGQCGMGLGCGGQ